MNFGLINNKTLSSVFAVSEETERVESQVGIKEKPADIRPFRTEVITDEDYNVRVSVFLSGRIYQKMSSQCRDEISEWIDQSPVSAEKDEVTGFINRIADDLSHLNNEVVQKAQNYGKLSFRNEASQGGPEEAADKRSRGDDVRKSLRKSLYDLKSLHNCDSNERERFHTYCDNLLLHTKRSIKDERLIFNLGPGTGSKDRKTFSSSLANLSVFLTEKSSASRDRTDFFSRQHLNFPSAHQKTGLLSPESPVLWRTAKAPSSPVSAAVHKEQPIDNGLLSSLVSIRLPSAKGEKPVSEDVVSSLYPSSLQAKIPSENVYVQPPADFLEAQRLFRKGAVGQASTPQNTGSGKPDTVKTPMLSAGSGITIQGAESSAGRQKQSMKTIEGKDTLFSMFQKASKDPHASQQFIQLQKTSLQTPEGRKAVGDMLGSISGDPQLSAAYVQTLALATKTPEGLKALTEVSASVSRDPQASAAFTQTLASATKTPEGLKAFTEASANVSRDPQASTSFTQSLALATKTPEGLKAFTEASANVSRDSQASTSFTQSLASATKTPEGLKAFTEASANVSRDSQASTSFTQSLASATKTPEGLKAFTEASANVSRDPQASTSFMQSLALATKTPEGLKAFTEASANVSRDPQASTSFTQSLASATKTPEGLKAFTEASANVSRDPQASADVMKTIVKSLNTPEGKIAYEKINDRASKDPNMASALLQTRASAAKTYEGSIAVSMEMSFISEDTKLQGSFVQSLNSSLDKKAGQNAFTELFLRSSDTASARESLTAILNKAQKSPDTKESLYSLYNSVSHDPELSSSMMVFMSRVPGSEKGRIEMVSFLGSVRSDAKIRNSFLDTIQSSLTHPQGVSVFSAFSNGIRSSQDLREEFVRTLTQMSAGGTGKEALKATLAPVFSRESTRDALFDIFNDSLLGTKGKTYFKHFVGNLEKDPELKSLFIDNFIQASSTARGQSRFLDMMKALNMEPSLIQQSEKMVRQTISTGLSMPPHGARPVMDGPVPMSRVSSKPERTDSVLHSKLMAVKEAAAADPRIVTEKAISSGIAVKMRRDVFGLKTKGADDIEEVSFDPEKLASNDPYEVYSDSNIRFTRECPHCGNRVFRRMEFCPDCMDNGREVVMRTRVTFRNRGQSFMAQEDWIEFSSTAIKVLIKERQEQIDMFREFTSRIIPKYREILALVKIYQ